MARHRQPSRIKRREKRAQQVGPEMMISHISLDRRDETLVCGHVLRDVPTYVPFDRIPNPPKYRRCIQCRGQHL